MAAFRFAFIITLVALLSACGGGGGTTSTPGSNTSQKANRVLGLDIANPAENNDFTNNITLAKGAGVEAVTLHLDWNVLEPGAPNNGTPVYDTNTLALVSAANSTYAANNLRLSLTLAPIDTNGIKVPSDLVNRAFYDFTSDPTGTCSGTQPLLDRFNQMVDTVLAQLPNVTLTSLQIGNEVDIELLKNHASPLDTLWNQYAVFTKCVRTHVQTQHPSLKVGVTFTYAGLTGNAGANFKEFNRIAATDVLGVTYYPLNPDFTVEYPLPVVSDLAALVSLYHTQAPTLNIPIFVQEIGLPTSAVNGSSATLQEQFVRDVFSVWDRYAADIPFLAFLRLHDLGTAASTTDKFSEYLRTLGLRSYSGSGTSKPGYCALKDEAGTRGWLIDNAPCP